MLPQLGCADITLMTGNRARLLRRGQTDAERKVWSRLRDRQLAGHKFRRQVVLGPFIVDFVCFDAQLVVELDGGQHGGAGQLSYDEKRTVWLEGEGFRLLRFWNNEVTDKLEGVLATIAEALRGR
jgi:very-short-patch-repair endonuclease